MKVLALYLLTLIGISTVAGSFVQTPSEDALQLLSNRAYELAIVAEREYGLPMERRPRLILTKTLDNNDAWANCRYWTIQVDVRLVSKRLDFVHDEIMPHEYAHLVRCYVTGEIGRDPHDSVWAEISERLGGPSSNYTGRKL